MLLEELSEQQQETKQKKINNLSNLIKLNLSFNYLEAYKEILKITNIMSRVTHSQNQFFGGDQIG